jgi:transcriptional regulator with XRE-family HTH domain
MKQTRDDEAFANLFGRELMRHYEQATREATGVALITDEQFAATLDVSRAALKKYLKGQTTPALRVVVLAYIRYGISVEYAGTALFGKRARSGKKIHSQQTQFVLPFSVEAMGTSSIQTRIEPKGENRFELKVDFRKAG